MLGEQLVHLAQVDLAAEEMREVAVGVPGRVVLDPARERLEQQARRAGLARSARGRCVLARLEVAGQEHLLGAVDEPAAHLVDVGGLADQPRVLVHLRLAPAGLDHDLDAGPVAGLERADREQREVALGVAQERRALAEHRAVEVGVDAAQRPAAKLPASVAIGGRSTTLDAARPTSVECRRGVQTART